MTSYGFPHHGNRSFAIAQDDVLQLTAISYQLTAIGHHSLSERLGLFIKIAAKGIQFLYISMYNKVQTEGSADHLYWCSFYLPVRKTAES